jgi:chromosome segregation ATPase
VSTLDGLNGPLEARGFVPGVNVVVGPNASGKSSLIRALRAVLYPGGEDGLVEVRLGLVADDGSPLLAHRLGEGVTWLRAGREASAPRLPSPDVLGAYVLELEDLVAGRDGRHKGGRGSVDEHIAERLQLELTGGVDFQALRKGLGTPGKGVRTYAADLRKAEKELSDLRRELSRLHEQEEALGAQEELLEAQRRLAARGAAVRAARDLAAAVAEAAAAAATLRDLPPALAELVPSDVEAVEEFARDLRAALEEAEERRRRLREAADVARGGRLPAALTLASAREHVALAEELCELHEQAAATAADLADQRDAVAESWRHMGGVAGHAGAERIDRAAVDGAASAALDVHAAGLEEERLSRRLREVEERLSALDEPFAAERVPAQRRAAHELARWLELPPPAPRLPGWAWGVTLALAAAALAAAQFLPAPWPAVGTGAALVWLLVAFAVWRRPRAPGRDVADAALSRALAAAGVSPPAELTHEAVARLLADVVEAASAAERRREERERLEELSARLRDELAEAQRCRQDAAAHLASLRDEHGFTARGDAGFVQWLALAREHALGLVRLRGLEARLGELEARHAAACSRVIDHLVAAGEPARADEAATVLRERCRRVCDAVAARDAAAAKVAELTQGIEASLAKAAAAARRLAALSERLGYRPEDLEDGIPASAEAWTPERVDGLRRHVARLVSLRSEYERARKRLADAEAQAELCRGSLSPEPELVAAAEAGDLAAIDAVQAEAERAEAEVKRLSEAIGALKGRLETAGKERALERAAAAARRARDDLEAHREARMEHAAASYLLDDVEGEHEAVAKPAALERAREWFGRVTRGDFELTFERSSAGWRFGAVDRRDGAADRHLRLEELSTGTRAQLLISARLAFALTAEEAATDETVETLPFVLDEALTTSDPVRFAQVAAAVLDVVEASGRQFVYLSARPEDAELWRKAAATRPGVPLAIIDLAGSAAAVERATAPSRPGLN